jgi:hypothetical protein
MKNIERIKLFKMGRNIDLTDLGLNTWNILCPYCKESAKDNLDEVDLDCDIKSHSPNTFIVNTHCYNCDNDYEIEIRMEVFSLRK